MFCQNCGKEISDNNKFCNYCGAVQNQENHGSAGENNNQKKEPKKKHGIFISLIIIAAALIVGNLLGKGMSKSYIEDSEPEEVVSDQTISQDIQEEEADNEEYLRIFQDRAIVTAPSFFVGMETKDFAKVNEDNNVEHFEIAYKDDIICTVVETIYTDVSGLSDEEKQAMDASVKETLGNMEHVTLSTNIGLNYYSFSCRIENLDDPEVIKKVKEYQLLDMSGDGVMSMTNTESSLLANGYIEK